MSRSLWKGPFLDSFLFIVALRSSQNSQDKGYEFESIESSGILRNPEGQSRNLQPSIGYKPFKKTRVWSRRSMILPEFLSQHFEIHNGKQFISLQVTEEMIGHKFGEFASTRKKTLHKKKLKK